MFRRNDKRTEPNICTFSVNVSRTLVYVHTVGGPVLAGIKLISPLFKQQSFTREVNSEFCAEPQFSLSFLLLTVKVKAKITI